MQVWNNLLFVGGGQDSNPEESTPRLTNFFKLIDGTAPSHHSLINPLFLAHVSHPWKSFLTAFIPMVSAQSSLEAFFLVFTRICSFPFICVIIWLIAVSSHFHEGRDNGDRGSFVCCLMSCAQSGDWLRLSGP